MAHRFSRSRISPAVTNRLRITTAVAAEQIMDEHVRSAVELVEEGGAHASVERLLLAYARIHQLGEQDARKVFARVLAALGRSGIEVGALEAPRSPFARLRRRLRGRVNQELREWVERHSARVELTLLDIHVENALRAVRLARPDIPVLEAVAAYAELLELRPAIAEMVRYRVLKALHEEESGHVEPLHPDRSIAYPLRVAENDR
jgi:hypothetical protein